MHMRTGAEKTLLLCSGGVESAVLVAQLLAARRHPVPLFADYSQRGAQRERIAARAVCASFEGVPPPQELDLRAEGGRFQAINRLHLPVPHRNLVLLSLALSWVLHARSASPQPHGRRLLTVARVGQASTLGCSQLAIGLNRDDFGKDEEFEAAGAVRYTTGTRAFTDRFRALANVVAPEVEVALPQAELSKPEVIRLGADLGDRPLLSPPPRRTRPRHVRVARPPRVGVPLHLTYSCMRGRERHCGTCIQCRARREAFVSAGVEEGDDVYET